MDQTRQLRIAEQAAFDRMRKSDARKVEKIGDTVQQMMDNLVSPQQSIYESVSEVWDEILPDELGRHCRVADTSRGQLRIIVDSPAYMYELRLCSSQLLTELQNRCPRARIKRIKLVLG
jgi:predicted nucleic acid-binding Zn ribbon protein